MFSPYAAAAIYATLTAMFFLLAIGLGLGAWRNHFHDRIRPAVVSEAALFLGLALFFSLRVIAQLVRSSGGDGTPVLTSPLSDAFLVWLLISSVVTFATLALVYPDVHDKEA